MASRTLRSSLTKRTFLPACVCLFLCVSAGFFNPVRAETREPCADHNPLRQPFFGDLHVHTTYSHDSYIMYNRNSPRDAYAFAKGEPLTLPDFDGNQTRVTQIDRPLDFVAVTDHSEYFDAMNICLTPGSPGYDSPNCVNMRGGEPGPCSPPPWLHTLQTDNFWNDNGVLAVPPKSFCQEVMGMDASVCRTNEIALWADVQAAAEEAYDRSSACEFTSFVGYEYTPTPEALCLHRNVIFRNSDVPETAFSYSDATSVETAVSELYSSLRTECLEAGGDCDVLAIPHNSNLSMGAMFEDPASVSEAEDRAFFEPLVEIHQTKGNSECRIGLGTTDEDCGFELTVMKYQGLDSITDPTPIPPRSFVRNVLKDGLALGRDLGVNPYKLGFVGGTDNHNGTAGHTKEKDYPGASGLTDDGEPGSFLSRLMIPMFDSWNPGGLTVVWAEENSRDSLFDAMRRKEVYATSGTRPVVRFFGGWSFDAGLCGDIKRDEIGYRDGVPMGSDLPSPASGAAPMFIVSAMKDPGTVEDPGTPLQRIQIIKGWVDDLGETHEMVYDVAGDPDNGAWVDEDTCEPSGPGANELCTVWTDPDFNPNLRAFYYARVMENPSCRYTTFKCLSYGINPFHYDEEGEPACPVDSPGGETCCNPDLQPAIQERAWTSPIWYSPR